jgi:hypothetical protein
VTKSSSLGATQAMTIITMSLHTDMLLKSDLDGILCLEQLDHL